MSYWTRFRESVADFFRPWFDNDFTRELWAGDEMPGFVRGALLRWASLSVSQNMPFGVFEMIGLKYARRAARATMPRELLLMEDVSFAFYGVWTRATEGRQVPSVHVERTTEALLHYFVYLGEDRDPEQVRRMVSEYVREQQRLAHHETKGLS